MVTSTFARLQGFEYTLARVCKMTTSQNAAIKVLPATMDFPITNCGLNIVSITSVHGLGGDV